MNSLSVNLKEGQKVVMEGNGPEAARTVTVKSGFGMADFTAGTGLMVKLSDGTVVRMDSMEIERLAN